VKEEQVAPVLGADRREASMKRRVLVHIAITGLLAGLMVGMHATPAQAHPSNTLICASRGIVQSCLRINYAYYAPTGGYRATRAAASLRLSNDCTAFPFTKYTNLWKEISYKEATGSDLSSCQSGRMYWNVEYWDTADGDSARIFPANTRFHSTWEGVDDSYYPHPIFKIP
jgi:hypothetical protein